MTTILLTALILDLITILIFACSIVYGVHKGFIHTVYRLFYWVIALALTNLLYPYLLQILSLSPVEDIVSSAVAGVFNISDAVSDATSSASEAIATLDLPDRLTSSLIENNNYEVYALLGVETLNEYITAYLTNLIMNAVSAAITFIIVALLLHIIQTLLKIVKILPVIKSLNRFLGFLAGAAGGVLYTWIYCLVLTLLGMSETFSIIYTGISNSLLTQFFYQHNILLNALLSIAIV